jgi:Domain of unknown function (DUF4389)
MAAVGEAPYPVTLELLAPAEVARWRPLVHWLLSIPYYVVLYVLQLVLGIITIVAWFAILFTGNIPDGIFGFMVLVHRVQWRFSSYFLFLREPYPPFEFGTEATDAGTDPPTRFSVDRPERLSRLLIFVKWLLAIPHEIVLVFLLIGAVFASLIGFFAVLITGRWPDGLRNYIVGVHRWAYRVQAYVYLLTDVYPPFRLEP